MGAAHDYVERVVSRLLAEKEREAAALAAHLKARLLRLRGDALRCLYLAGLDATLRGGIEAALSLVEVTRGEDRVCMCFDPESGRAMLREGEEIGPGDYERIKAVYAVLEYSFGSVETAGVFRLARAALTWLLLASAILLILAPVLVAGAPALFPHVVVSLASTTVGAVVAPLALARLALRRLRVAERGLRAREEELEHVCRGITERLRGFTGSVAS